MEFHSIIVAFWTLRKPNGPKFENKRPSQDVKIDTIRKEGEQKIRKKAYGAKPLGLTTFIVEVSPRTNDEKRN